MLALCDIFWEIKNITVTWGRKIIEKLTIKIDPKSAFFISYSNCRGIKIQSVMPNVAFLNILHFAFLVTEKDNVDIQIEAVDLDKSAPSALRR